MEAFGLHAWLVVLASPCFCIHYAALPFNGAWSVLKGKLPAFCCCLVIALYRCYDAHKLCLFTQVSISSSHIQSFHTTQSTVHMYIVHELRKGVCTVHACLMHILGGMLPDWHIVLLLHWFNDMHKQHLLLHSNGRFQEECPTFLIIIGIRNWLSRVQNDS